MPIRRLYQGDAQAFHDLRVILDRDPAGHYRYSTNSLYDPDKIMDGWEGVIGMDLSSDQAPIGYVKLTFEKAFSPAVMGMSMFCITDAALVPSGMTSPAMLHRLRVRFTAAGWYWAMAHARAINARAITAIVAESNHASRMASSKVFGHPWGTEPNAAWNPVEGVWESMLHYRLELINGRPAPRRGRHYLA